MKVTKNWPLQKFVPLMLMLLVPHGEDDENSGRVARRGTHEQVLHMPTFFLPIPSLTENLRYIAFLLISLVVLAYMRVCNFDSLL